MGRRCAVATDERLSFGRSIVSSARLLATLLVLLAVLLILVGPAR